MEADPGHPPTPPAILLQPWPGSVPLPPRRPRTSCCCCRDKRWLRRRRPKPSGNCSLASCRSGTLLQPPPNASKLHLSEPPNRFSPANAPIIPTRAGAAPVLLHPLVPEAAPRPLLPLSHLPRSLHRRSCPGRSRAAGGVSTRSARSGARPSARPRTRSCARTSRSSARPSHGSWTARTAPLRWLWGLAGHGGCQGTHMTPPKTPQALLTELKEAEEQQNRALRSHLHLTDQLLHLQRCRLGYLEQGFSAQVGALKAEFEAERCGISEGEGERGSSGTHGFSWDGAEPPLAPQGPPQRLCQEGNPFALPCVPTEKPCWSSKPGKAAACRTWRWPWSRITPGTSTRPC